MHSTVSIYQSPLWKHIIENIYKLPVIDAHNKQILLKQKKKRGIQTQRALCQGIDTTAIDHIESYIRHNNHTPLFVQYGLSNPLVSTLSRDTKHPQDRQRIINTVTSFHTTTSSNTLHKPHTWRTNVNTPAATIILDTSCDDAQRRATMSQSGRRQYRKACKAHISVTQSNKLTDRSIFYSLRQETAAHQGFHIREREKIHALGKYLIDNDAGSLWLAYDTHNNVCASAIVLHNQDTSSLYYMYGASSKDTSTLSAPYLLHQTIADRGHTNGYTGGYDLGGVASLTQSNSSRGPLTQFKRALGGMWIEYGGSVDIIHNRVGYTMYTLGRTVFR